MKNTKRFVHRTILQLQGNTEIVIRND